MCCVQPSPNTHPVFGAHLLTEADLRGLSNQTRFFVQNRKLLSFVSGRHVFWRIKKTRTCKVIEIIVNILTDLVRIFWKCLSVLL